MAKTKDTPEGAGREYETAAAGSANENGKASAIQAGGNPVTSPVIGNPGESNPAAGNYDYGLATSNPQASVQPLNSAAVEAQKAPAAKGEKVVQHPKRVRALRRGEYDGLREPGDIFDNSRNLAAFPDDEHSWFEAAE